MIAKIGENMNLRRAKVVEVSEGVVAPYVHNVTRNNLGKIGVLVALESKRTKPSWPNSANILPCTSPLPSRCS